MASTKSIQNDTVELLCSGPSVSICFNTFQPETQSKSCPIILLHSTATTKEVWNDVAQLLADKTSRQVYAYDSRNHGGSEFAGGFNLDLNVSDLLSFMDTKKIEKAVLIGYSMGGQTASRTALRMPERVEAVVSEEMYVKKLPAEFFSLIVNFIEKYIACAEKVPKGVDSSEATGKLFDIMKSEEKDQSVLDEIEILRTANYILRQIPDGAYDVKFNKEVILNVLKSPDSFMSEPEGTFEGPALFVYGSDSTMKVGDDKENILKHFPKAELFEVASSKHHVHVEHPTEFVEKVATFLKS